MRPRPFSSSDVSSKIWPKKSVDEKLNPMRADGKRIVHCHGVFDLLHPGHLDHLAEARDLGDFLVVSVTSDSMVNKGPGRPLYPISERMRMLASLEFVDAVFESSEQTAEGAINLVRPVFYVKGPDYKSNKEDETGFILREKEAVERHGGSIRYTEAATQSSSSIINKIGQTHSKDTEAWLSNFRKGHSPSDVKSALSAVSSLKVLVVGELIVDKYVFCEALGKTSKEPVLAFLRGSEEVQMGGSLAVARHVSGLGAETKLFTRIGRDRPGGLAQLAAVEANVRMLALESESQPTIVKTRYLDNGSGVKVFETYEMSDDPVSSEDDEAFCTQLADEVLDVDLVLVCDYGHGLMSARAVDVLKSAPGLVSVNTQSNAGNRGINSLSRYPRIDIVSLNGGELSLELRRRHALVKDLIPSLGLQSGARWVVVTEGSRGLAFWTPNSGVTQFPAFTEHVKDRVGAGDALFAMVSVLIAANSPTALVGFFGNLAGAAMVADLGNRNFLSRVDMLRHGTALLK